MRCNTRTSSQIKSIGNKEIIKDINHEVLEENGREQLFWHLPKSELPIRDVYLVTLVDFVREQRNICSYVPLVEIEQWEKVNFSGNVLSLDIYKRIMLRK